VRISNLRLLGFDLYITAFARFVPSSTLKTRADAVERLLKLAPVFFLMSDDAEIAVVGTSKSYEQFSTLRAGLTKHFQERGYLQGEPEVYVSMTSATEILRNCEFGSLVQDLTAPPPKSNR